MSPSGPSTEDLEAEVLQNLEAKFSSWDDLVSFADKGLEQGEGSRKTALGLEIEKWQQMQDESDGQLREIEIQLPILLAKSTQTLNSLLQTASSLSFISYPLYKALEPYLADLDIFHDQVSELSQHKLPEVDAPLDERGYDIVGRLEDLKDRLEGLKRGRTWLEKLETVMSLTQAAVSSLSESSSTNSPLESLPQFKSLYTYISSVQPSTPSYYPHSHDQAEDTLLAIAETAQVEVWEDLKSRLSANLEKTLDGIGWPKKFDYPSLSVEQRKPFEVAFRELLTLQAEAENLGMDTSFSGKEGLYAFRTLIQSVGLRFRFHFEGSRGTNRLDKPEWAFTNILDFLFDQRGFTEEYLQGLLDRNWFKDIDAKSELTAQVLSLPLSLLQARLPHLLPHPALLAHTVYQTVIFDETILAGGFRIDKTFSRRQKKSLRNEKNIEDWKGLTREFLESEGCFEGWLNGEKTFADEQFNEIVSSPDAWTIVDEGSGGEDDEGGLRSDLKPTNGTRQVQVLIEQVTDRYSSLPALSFKLPFLTTIQLPILTSYYSRITSSLEAFETLSSSFARAVPGALAGHSGRDGLSVESGRITSGLGGLQRLIKAWVSAAWMQEVMGKWGDELTFVQILAGAQDDAVARAEFEETEGLPSLQVKRGESAPSSVFDVLLAQYAALVKRAEDMITRHVCFEVERDLKQHLTRRWDSPSTGSESLDWAPGPELFTPLTTLTTHLGHLAQAIPPVALTRLYRAIVAHISNHILQRAVYAGWSKYTEVGGQEFRAEVEAWCEASQMGLQRESSGSVRKPDAPWKQLKETATILALGTEAAVGDLSMTQAMDLAFGDGFGFLQGKLNLKELNQEQVQGVMRRRLDCWR